MQSKEPFERCPNCHKYILPPGLIIVVSNLKAPHVFCDTQGGCGQIECNMAKRAFEWRDVPINEQDVLAEAEAILKEARER